MRRLLAATLLAVGALAAPAGADTVAHRTPATGPAFAGHDVVWGEQSRARGVRIRAGRPGREMRTLYRLRAPRGARSQRGFFHTPWSLAASPTHVAAIVHTNTITSQGSDFVGISSTSAAVGGPLDAPALLAGSTPERSGRGCRGAFNSPDAVAVDGSRIAIAAQAGTCRPAQVRNEITVIDGERRHVVEAGDGRVIELRLAGRFLAWTEEDRDHTLVVHDLDGAAEVARLARDQIGDFDLDATGAVALSYSNGTPGSRLGLWRAGVLRDLDRGVASRGVALAAGRILYVRYGRGDLHGRLLLRGATGPARRLATFTPTRRRVGDLDLTPLRAAWAARRNGPEYADPPRGPARIVVRRL